MYHLKLIKSLSYHGIVSATKDKPDVYTAEQSIADEAVATGFFALVESPEQDTPDDGATSSQDEKQGKVLEDMTVSEIETFATYHGVSLKGIKGKAKIILHLRKVLGDIAEGEVTCGSPTMTELQKK